LARERVVGLSWFRTETVSRDVLALHAGVNAASPPVAQLDALLTGSEIDALLGTPAAAGPGIDRPPAAGTEGDRAISHDTTALVLKGSFRARRFVTGAGSEVGTLQRDDAGLPRSDSEDEVPFVLIVPQGVDLASLPVVIAHHGFNASRTTGFALADTAGRAGYAVLAIDAYQHGERAASARDELNALRGTDSPDGFAETTPLDVSSRVFGLSGTAEGMTLFPGYPLAAFEQFAADLMSAVRLVREGDLSALQGADPSLATLGFDPQRIAFVGNSMGAVVGVSLAVAEPAVGAFVLDVMPGSIIETLAESGEFRPLTETLLLPLLGVREHYDELHRAMVFDPTVDLMRWVMEPVDPLALAPHLLVDRLTEQTPDVLIQLAGHDEVAAPTASESVVAAASIPGVGEFGHAPVQPTALPLAASQPAFAAVRFDAAMHGMLEVHDQSSSFEAPLAPPLTSRATPVMLHNPIEAVHDQIATFLQSYAEEGRARIVH
jgi:pimeloyl-ACP methyl ester carboxylesterase